MINKIRKYFGLREKIKIDDVTIFLPIQFSVGLTGIEFRSKRFICSSRSWRLVQYLKSEGFIPDEKHVYVKVCQK